MIRELCYWQPIPMGWKGVPDSPVAFPLWRSLQAWSTLHQPDPFANIISFGAPDQNEFCHGFWGRWPHGVGGLMAFFSLGN